MAAKSNFKNMVLCLFLTCLICSAILGCVYAVTKAPIDKTNQALLKKSIEAVLPSGGELSTEPKSVEVGGQPSEYYECKGSDGKVMAYAVKSTTVGFGGPLTIMVGVRPDGSIVNTSVFSHSETPGLGAKCTSDPAFVAQWKDFPAEKILSVKKDGGDVDAITASTITSRAYAKAVKNAKEAAEKLSK